MMRPFLPQDHHRTTIPPHASRRLSAPVRFGRATVTGIVIGLPVSAAALLGAAYIAFAGLPPVPQPAENPTTEEKRVLGKILFFEEQLSSTNTIACATCHVSNRAGTDPRQARNPGPDGVLNTPDDKLASPGVLRAESDGDYIRDAMFGTAPQITPRTTNSNINSAFAPVLFWDGRATGEFHDPVSGDVLIVSGGALESQSVQPPLSSVEMAHDGIVWSDVTSKLLSVKPLDLATNHPADVSVALSGGADYPELFRRAFGDTEITAARVAFALAAFQRTLISDQTPWDRFDAGDQTALTPGQQVGLQAFQNGNCNLCHIPPLFTGNGFRNIGIRPPAEDRGLQLTTGNPNDRGKFKVPGLRNVGLKRSFMHTGHIATLTDVIRFYARAPGAPPQFGDNQDPIMNQVNVPPQVAPALEDFLRNGLLDVRVRDQLFPFDRATLASERNLDRITFLNGGVAGTGGILPRIIADTPGLLGTTDFRVGVDMVLGGTSARLAYSVNPPTGGRITPDGVLAELTTPGTGAGRGPATAHWHLSPRKFAGGQVIFLQWFVDDPAAQGGESISNIARIPIFCGSSGCAQACAADFDDSGFLDTEDYDRFVDAFETGNESADFDASGFVDTDDFDAFVRAFDAGC